MHIQFQLAQQCIQISTRINSSSVHTYIFVCSTLRVVLQGFVTQNATWCQNRGCICISSTRRTYGRIHMLPVIQTSTIILWTELFPKKRREKISKVLQSIFEYRYSGVSTYNPAIPTRITKIFEYSVFYKNYSVSTRNPVILHTELILLQEILQLQGPSRAGSIQQLFPVSPSILHGRTRLLQHSKRSIHKQASSNSTRQKQHSTRQPASTQSLQQFPGQVLHYRILPGFIPKGSSIACPCNTKVSVF